MRIEERIRGSNYRERNEYEHEHERKSHEGIQVRNERTFSAWYCLNASDLESKNTYLYFSSA